jgi:large subunit ribosomal protein L15
VRLHDLKVQPGARRGHRRVGRGISAGGGKTAGKGTKGQLARSGPGLPGWFEGGQTPIHMRVPKLRGFRNRFRAAWTPVNVARLGEAVEEGRVTPETLARKGLIREGARIKVLGDGDVSRALEVHAHAVSASARKKIEAAGGSVRIIEAEGAPPPAEAEPR